MKITVTVSARQDPICIKANAWEIKDRMLYLFYKYKDKDQNYISDVAVFAEWLSVWVDGDVDHKD